MPKTVQVVDDEPKIVRLLQAYLEQAGYRVIAALDGTVALAQFRQEQPDLVVLDLNLPGMDGLEVCREIRRESKVPILMLTARIEEADKLLGLELGADDYVVKPFSPREVVARVRTVLRRTEDQGGLVQDTLRAGCLRIDLARHEAFREAVPVDLTPMEFDLLAVLARQPGRVFTRLQLLEQTQGNTDEGYERTIDTHIKNLRLKIEADPKNPDLIQTVYGVGYKLQAGSCEK